MAKKNGTDAAPWHDGKAKPRSYEGIARSSSYLAMRDGTRLALDLYLPRNLGNGDRIPAILHQTRYYRRIRLNWPFSWFAAQLDPMYGEIERIVEHGYAYANIDVRGSGASFGSRQMEWSPGEVQDGAEVVDWIVAQPWSNGRVGATGVSYTGTAAEMLLTNQHPAVKAANLQFSLFDIFADIVRPGGVRNQEFMKTWSSFNDALDHGRLSDFAQEQMGCLAGLAVKGAAPVDSDARGALARQAIVAHQANYDIYTESLQVHFRDDRTQEGIGLDDFSPHAFRREIEASGAAIQSWSGWYDGAWAVSAINRFLNVKTPGSRLILGPWDHGALQNPSPYARKYHSRFDRVAETLRFFDLHLNGHQKSAEDDPPVRYYTMGEEAWNEAETWPPPGFAPTPFYLGEGHSLRPEDPPSGQGADSYQVDHSTGSGTSSRWMSTVNVAQAKIEYPDRRQQDAKLLVYDSAPLEQAIEVTGHPIITLYIRSNATNGQFFVYLEDVTGDGEVHYVTEGLFQARYRKISPEAALYDSPVPCHTFRRQDALRLVPGEVAELTFDLQPVSYLFHRGHRIRVAIAGADKDNFEIYPPEPPLIDVQRSEQHPSYIVLPVRYH